jgi:hypothetical protein
VREPAGYVLVQQDVEQFEVGAVGPGPDAVPRVRPAQCRVQQAPVARGHHDLVVGAEAQPRHVASLHVADLATARNGSACEVLDVDDVERAIREPAPRGHRLVPPASLQSR